MARGGQGRLMARRVELPDSARCVVIGGGVGGTSIAYHLAQLGWDDVVLLERSQLTSGSTFHSAGLVGQLRGSVTLTKMMMYSVELYRKLGEESEFDPGWTECGSLRLASSEERMEELRRQAGWAKTFGLPDGPRLGRGGQGEVPADVDRRRPGRGLDPHRRLPGSRTAHQRARRRRSSRRLSDLHQHPGDRHRRGRRAGAGGPYGARRHRRRGRRQRGRHVRRRDRADGGSPHPGDPDVTPVPDHGAIPRARRGPPADASRS